MSATGYRYVYGPVFSRRLGRSLGIDLVPYKTCTYDCVYCQLGRTTHKTVERKEYTPIVDVLNEVERKLAAGPPPEYITLSGSGEPTLNSRIGDLIGGIKCLTDVPVAVLTNGSLLWVRDVSEALMAADLIIPSLDAGDERMFRYVNRPHGKLAFERMVTGLAEFTERFAGPVWLEVFLLAGVTGIAAEVEKIAVLAERIRPARIQLNTVSRPPAEEFAMAVPRDQLERFKTRFTGTAEVICEREAGEAPASSAQETTDEDIMALLRRRPCTVQGICAGLGLRTGDAVERLRALCERGAVRSVRKNAEEFYYVVRER
jgi:wyosine [tRNA(Phe)-imidazoG37] synthetase (radical SAM superfamily)